MDRNLFPTIFVNHRERYLNLQEENSYLSIVLVNYLQHSAKRPEIELVFSINTVILLANAKHPIMQGQLKLLFTKPPQFNKTLCAENRDFVMIFFAHRFHQWIQFLHLCKQCRTVSNAHKKSVIQNKAGFNLYLRFNLHLRAFYLSTSEKLLTDLLYCVQLFRKSLRVEIYFTRSCTSTSSQEIIEQNADRTDVVFKSLPYKMLHYRDIFDSVILLCL